MKQPWQIPQVKPLTLEEAIKQLQRESEWRMQTLKEIQVKVDKLESRLKRLEDQQVEQ